jgi:hypothetical protein
LPFKRQASFDEHRRIRSAYASFKYGSGAPPLLF